MSQATTQPFLTDVKTLRERARQHLERGAYTESYRGDVQQAIDILQTVLATEIVCVLRYTMHSISAVGIDSESVKAEFAEHAKEEQEHMMKVAERINQLGGVPNMNPEGLATRSASQYAEGENLIGMIRENLIAERIAVDHYRGVDPLLRRQGPCYPRDAGGNPDQRGRACERHARPSGCP